MYCNSVSSWAPLGVRARKTECVMRSRVHRWKVSAGGIWRPKTTLETYPNLPTLTSFLIVFFGRLGFQSYKNNVVCFQLNRRWSQMICVFFYLFRGLYGWNSSWLNHQTTRTRSCFASCAGAGLCWWKVKFLYRICGLHSCCTYP